MIEQTKPRSQSDSTSSSSSPTHVHYRVLGLTFLMAFLMYMERGAIGAAAPGIMAEFHIDKITMGWCVSAFNWSYALFQVPGGWMADRLGSRIVLAGAIAWWSTFTAGTGLSFSALSLAGTRFLFGAGEAAAFPAGSRALQRWLPIEQRAFGQGFQHAGSRLGAALAPAIVVSLMAVAGWRWVFFMFGGAGVLWAGLWYWYYRDNPSEHPGTNEAERDLLKRKTPSGSARIAGVPWSRILHSRDLWYLSAAYFSYGWVLWLYLAWFPTYLREARHFSALKSGLASVPLLAAALTNVLGGVLSDKLVMKFQNLKRGRLTVSIIGFLIAGFALLPGVLAGSSTTALIWLTIALGGLEMTVAVSWAMCLDIGGDYCGSVSSVMNTWGNLGGAFSAAMVGYLATLLGWTSPFLIASAFCLLSALAVSRIDPRRSAV